MHTLFGHICECSTQCNQHKGLWQELIQPKKRLPNEVAYLLIWFWLILSFVRFPINSKTIFIGSIEVFHLHQIFFASHDPDYPFSQDLSCYAKFLKMMAHQKKLWILMIERLQRIYQKEDVDIKEHSPWKVCPLVRKITGKTL